MLHAAEAIIRSTATYAPAGLSSGRAHARLTAPLSGVSPGVSRSGFSGWWNSLLSYGIDCGLMFAVKLALTQALIDSLSAASAYAVVQFATLVASYGLHSRLAFHVRPSWKTFARYTRTVLLFKVLDYGIFVGLFETVGGRAPVAIAVATLAVFLMRFMVVRIVFVQAEVPHGAR